MLTTRYIDESGTVVQGWTQRNQAEQAIKNPIARIKPQVLEKDEIIEDGRVRPLRVDEPPPPKRIVLEEDEWIDEHNIVREGFTRFDIKPQEESEPVRVLWLCTMERRNQFSKTDKDHTSQSTTTTLSVVIRAFGGTTELSW